MSAQNQAIAKRLIEELWNNRKLELADELLAPTFVSRDPNTPDLGIGPESFKRLVLLYTTAFPDLKFSIEEMVSDEDTVVVRWRSSGTHQGQLGGIAPTNKSATVLGITIAHIRDGKIADDVAIWDALGMYRQLGVTPEMESSKGRAA